MAVTQDDLDKLDAAIASGAKKVKYRDREVEYQSTDEMLKARTWMSTQLAATSGGSGERVQRSTFNKGYQ